MTYYAIVHCLKGVKKPHLIDVRFFDDKELNRHIPFTLRAQMLNAFRRDGKKLTRGKDDRD